MPLIIIIKVSSFSFEEILTPFQGLESLRKTTLTTSTVFLWFNYKVAFDKGNSTPLRKNFKISKFTQEENR